VPEQIAPHPVPGQILAGRYRIERFLAQGGYGAVYVAEQLATEALVAVKVLWPHVLSSQEVVDRFELEAKVAGRVRSDFIVRILDAGIDETTRMPFLVMELLEGRSLLDHVKTSGPLGAAEIVTFMMQVAQGLDKAHGYTTKDGKALPIVHRDLKPENLFLTVRDDGLRVVKILDFGIAKILRENVTISRGIKGTPLYMAFEQAAGAAASPQTDIWAFGLIVFFLATGRSYWRAASAEEVSVSSVIAEVMTGPIVSPTLRAKEFGIEPSWGKAFDDWFLGCVNRDPKARFRSAGDAAKALAVALVGEKWAATLPPMLVNPLVSSSDAYAETVSASQSESIPSPVASTGRPTPPLGASRRALVATLLLFVLGLIYFIVRREPTLTPISDADLPADAHSATKTVAASNLPPPDASPVSHTSAPAAAASSAAVAPSSQPLTNVRQPKENPRVQAYPSPSRTAPRASASRIYDER
jgi:eukaryotic-like serine/threonine-protein kinase